MNLKNLTTKNLLDQSARLASEERRITTELLYHWMEIETRKAYAPKYKNLHQYATEELKYTNASAGRRISAMWALKKNPDLKQKLDSGDLNVSNVATVNAFIRREEKAAGKPMEHEAKKDLFEKAENASQENLARTLYSISPQSAVRETKRPLAVNLNEMRLFLSDEDLKSFQEVQELLAARLQNPSSASEAFAKMIELTKSALIREKIEEPVRARKVEGSSSVPLTERKISPDLGASVEPRTPPASVKRAIYRRAKMTCEHRDETGHPCGSRFRLEIHHRRAYARGGSSHDSENLQLLCVHHHRIESVKEFGQPAKRPKKSA